MIRWGVSGTGGMASLFLLDAKNISNGRFTSVCSQSAERAASFASDHGLDTAYGSYEQMLADDDIDAIYIAGIHTTHAPQAIAALNAGKHVLVEKPMSLTHAEASAVFEAARSNARFCAEALWTKFNPAFQAVVADIQSGRIGDIKHLQASFGFAVDMSNTQQRLLNPDLAGGALLDIGLYPITLPLTILGLPESTQAKVTHGPTGVDIAADLILNYAEGVTASLSYRFDAYMPTKATVSGSDGWLEMETPWFASNAVHWWQPSGAVSTQHYPLKCRGWGLEFESVNEDILAGKLESQWHTHEQSLQLADYLETFRTEFGPIYPFEK